ncbi:MAG: exodeoxyribonuclease VII large subunit [Paracoccus denitrificans]|nr:MAG: exodeoxyribonuclease VII large subunit [Paracoccus denitrificans]PZO83521.1 MAG: exodeoxyribonuclease VII large subunit [Paracoccus denitrificans]
MELFEDDNPDPGASPGNAPALSVSEISGAVKRVIEGEFGRVRVRGEVGRVSRPASGHLYFDLKDDNATIAAVSWRGAVSKLTHRPEEGMEIIATGRLTTFPGQSKYQLIVEDVVPAGAGALMAMLEQRRKMLAAEGIFDTNRKRPIPYLPQVIAVVTSPSGAVIRDILHRLRDRFPSRVLIWPVAVQGRDSAPQVAAAIRGLNAIGDGDALPRPDLIIVARGGGSIEDLWGFNEEIVVRAVAEGTIPLISAVGHETDTTLIDHAADLRAPTPTAAAEMAVPVRAELAARMAESHARLIRAIGVRHQTPRQRLIDIGRALARPQMLVEPKRQRLDLTGPRLESSLRSFTRDRRSRVDRLHLPAFALRTFTSKARARFAAVAERPEPALRRDLAQSMRQLAQLGARLVAARARTLADTRRVLVERRRALSQTALRLDQIIPRQLADRHAALVRLDRTRQSLGYTETLRRGFAVVRAGDQIVTTAAGALTHDPLIIQFQDDSVVVRHPTPAGDQTATPKKKAARPKTRDEPKGQMDLL